MQIKEKIGPMFSRFKGMMGGGDADDKISQMSDKFEEFKKVVDKVNKQFKDHTQTTFVAVCIPEFLSMYETE